MGRGLWHDRPVPNESGHGFMPIRPLPLASKSFRARFCARACGCVVKSGLYFKEKFMRMKNARRVAAENGHVLEYDLSLRLYVLADANDKSIPMQWFPGFALRDMSEETFKYFYMGVDLKKVLSESDVPQPLK